MNLWSWYLVSGITLVDTRSLTKATFSEDLPSKAIKILTFKDDLVLDCFSGSGTTIAYPKS